jgi:pilus assembly protein CpaF
LRVLAPRSFSLDDCVRSGSLTAGGAELLQRIVAARLAFLVSGGTGSGKTTLLGALLALVPAQERIVIVEDSRELAPNHPHVVRLEARLPNAERVGAITLTDLVRQSLRMRPDRLVVGEVRGSEICDLLMALNTGHEGGCGTVHANSAQDVPARLEALAALGGLTRSALHAQLTSALHAVIHVIRDKQGLRRVSEVSVLVREPASGLVHAERAVQFTSDGRAIRGPGGAELERLLG